MHTTRNIEALDFLRPRFEIRNVTKVILDLNGIKQTDLAKDVGLNVQTIYSTLNHHRKNPRVMAAISRRLGIQVRELFPPNKDNGNGQ